MAIRRAATAVSERIATYILVWAGDEPEQLSYDGETFWMPPKDEVARRGEGSQYRYDSAEDRSGLLIPGSVYLTDRYAMVEGQRTKVFDVETFVKFLEQTRPELLKRGLVICDLPEEVEEAKALGRPMWEASKDQEARTILERELTRRKKYEDKGVPAPVSSSDHRVQWAVQHLNERGSALSVVATDAILKALSKVAPVPGAPAAGASPMVARAAAAAKAAEANELPAGSDVYQRAKALGIAFRKDQLEGLLADEPEAVKAAQGLIAAKTREVEGLTSELRPEKKAKEPAARAS